MRKYGLPRGLFADQFRRRAECPFGEELLADAGDENGEESASMLKRTTKAPLKTFSGRKRPQTILQLLGKLRMCGSG
jgi:hypothetical protein